MSLDPSIDLLTQCIDLSVRYWPLAGGIVLVSAIFVLGIWLRNGRIEARFRMIEARLDQVARLDERRFLIALNSQPMGAANASQESANLSIVPEVVENDRLGVVPLQSRELTKEKRPLERHEWSGFDIAIRRQRTYYDRSVKRQPQLSVPLPRASEVPRDLIWGDTARGAASLVRPYHLLPLIMSVFGTLAHVIKLSL